MASERAATATAVLPAAADAAAAKRGEWRKYFRGNSALVIGSVLVFIVVFLGIFGPALAPYDPDEPNYAEAKQAPSWDHPFGTDKFGRDQFSRVLHGARVDMSIGIIATFVPAVIGVVIGAIAGFYGGLVDTLLMRVIDIMVAFPFYVLLIAILAILGPGQINMYYALILTGWVAFARLIRGEILVAKVMEYAVAARTIGNTDRRIILRHLLPNVIAPIMIYATSGVVLSILAGAALGFLGLGVQPPNPEWGVMIADSREFMTTAWWLPFFPGVAIAIVGIAFSMLGDGLTQAMRRRNR